MKQNLLLTITSLLSILFMTFHLTDDIVRGFEKGGVSNLTAVPIVVAWLYGALVLAGRRSTSAWAASTRGRVQLKQSEMVRILGLQRTDQNLKSWQLA